MRTFHTGGVAGSDITQGLPRVEELFEARKPKGLAIISEIDGVVTKIEDIKRSRKIYVENKETGEKRDYLAKFGSSLKVEEGQNVEAGDYLTEGSIDPHDLLKIKGIRAVQDYLLKEVQRVYRLQGVDIADKHIEVLVRQMLRKVRIDEPGDTELLSGTQIDKLDFEEINEQLIAEGKKPVEATQIILGITKAALATDSFMSAASFQETTKVLTDAAIKGKTDPLIGLKENVIIGKLIPAGTGLKRYRNITLSTDLNNRNSLNEAEDAEVVFEAATAEVEENTEE
jgi:DNA-directed RNA polymerase subunit beta'